MQGLTLCVVQANHGFATIDLPVSQGSKRIVYAPFAELKSDADAGTSGEKMRRKLASAFKCLTVNDMADPREPKAGQAAMNRDFQAMANCLFCLLVVVRRYRFPSGWARVGRHVK
jgi:hypothetical protein